MSRDFTFAYLIRFSFDAFDPRITHMKKILLALFATTAMAARAPKVPAAPAPAKVIVKAPKQCLNLAGVMHCRDVKAYAAAKPLKSYMNCPKDDAAFWTCYDALK